MNIAKKILFHSVAILMVTFAFVACDKKNSDDGAVANPSRTVAPSLDGSLFNVCNRTTAMGGSSCSFIGEFTVTNPEQFVVLNPDLFSEEGYGTGIVYDDPTDLIKNAGRRLEDALKSCTLDISIVSIFKFIAGLIQGKSMSRIKDDVGDDYEPTIECFLDSNLGYTTAAYPEPYSSRYRVQYTFNPDPISPYMTGRIELDGSEFINFNAMATQFGGRTWYMDPASGVAFNYENDSTMGLYTLDPQDESLTRWISAGSVVVYGQ